MAQTIFKGVLRFGKLKVPVKLRTAVRDDRIQFHLLHDKDNQRVIQQMFCSVEQVPVDRPDQVKGFEISEGQYVILQPAELEAIEPETDRSIEILYFTPADTVDFRAMVRHYYLSPDANAEAYSVFHRALADTHCSAVCQWTMRKRSYFGAVYALEPGLLALVTLRRADEIVDPDSLEHRKPEVTRRELDLAANLVERMSDAFEPQRYRNDYDERLRHYLTEKAKGREPKLKRPARREEPVSGDLEATLAASLKSLGTR